MTVDRFLQPGEAERIKAGVHAAVGLLAFVCGVYNAAAWATRRERHLGVNAVLYTGLAIWEACHVRRHGQQNHQCQRDQQSQDLWRQPGCVQWDESPDVESPVAAYARH